LLGILGGSLAIDPIVNAITGKRARLKKELAVERKELLLQRLSNIFSDQYYTEKLQISKDHVQGFKLYVVEYSDAENFLQWENVAMVHLEMSDLAVEYKQTIAREK
jgi:hypothetical protein